MSVPFRELTEGISTAVVSSAMGKKKTFVCYMAASVC